MTKLWTQLSGACLAAVVILQGGLVEADQKTDQEIKDSTITQAIEDRLMQDAAVVSHRVDVATQQGIVTLSGEVTNILARDRAVALAESIKGVRAVVNQLKVAASERKDREIQQDVKDALYVDPATKSYQIQARVNDGIVTLTGTVQSWQESELAEQVAKGVWGVRDVINRIGVTYKKDRAASEIKADVKGRLKQDIWVDDALIEVKVKDDQVILSGTVGSAAERTRAIRDAQVLGVQKVNAEDLKVDRWWSRQELQRKYAHATPSDKEMRQAIQDALLYDPRVVSFRVQVEVDNGQATLTGKVDSARAKQAAGMAAQHTVGVWSVKNLLKVRPEKIPTDKTIAGQVRDALLRDPYVNRFDLTVSVSHGRVYLSGKVDSRFERSRAETVASTVTGVTDVSNWIAVQSPYDPPRVAGYWTNRDREIREEVRDELYWNPWVDSDSIRVKVNRGVVTLRGTVESRQERHTAVEEALEGGASSVVDNLTVNKGS